MLLFADDTTVYNRGRHTSHEFTNSTERAIKWFVINKLTVNVENAKLLALTVFNPCLTMPSTRNYHLKDIANTFVFVLTQNSISKTILTTQQKMNKFCGMRYEIGEILSTRCLLVLFKKWQNQL